MLKGIDPLLNAELLHALATMGHGDEIAVVDANFPAASIARRLIRLDGVDAPRALAAILTLLPIDSFTVHPVHVMQVVGSPGTVPGPVGEFIPLLNRAAGSSVEPLSLERQISYERARACFAIVATGEQRKYGNIIVTKGVIATDQQSTANLDPTLRRPLGATSLSLTQMGFGGAPLGNMFQRVPPKVAARALHAALASGLGYFDTAPLYGHGLSEQRMGNVLAAVSRERFVLSTKVGRLLVPAPDGRVDSGNFVDVPALTVVYDYSYDGTLRSLEASQKRLGLGRVDIVYIHDIDRFTHGAEKQPSRFCEAMGGAYRALARLKAEGTISAIGLGVNEWQVCQKAAGAADFDCFLIAGRHSLLEQEALETFLPLCERRGIGVVIGGPFNSGILATGPIVGAMYNYSPAPPPIMERARRLAEVCATHAVKLASAALQFPLFHPAVASIIPGARSPSEIRKNIALMLEPLPGALWSDLKTSGLIRQDAPTPSN